MGEEQHLAWFRKVLGVWGLRGFGFGVRVSRVWKQVPWREEPPFDRDQSFSTRSTGLKP